MDRVYIDVADFESQGLKGNLDTIGEESRQSGGTREANWGLGKFEGRLKAQNFGLF